MIYKKTTACVIVLAAISLIIMLPSPETGLILSAEPIKIGFIGPLSGMLAYTGEPVKNGFELAHEQNQFVDGKRIEVIYEDGKCNTKEAVDAANKLTEIDDVNVIVSGVCSSSTLGIAPIAEKKGIILVSPVAASPDITNAGDYVFRISSSSTLMASNAARISKEMGYNTAGILYELNDYPIGWKDEFADNFEKLGGKVLIEEGVNVGETDMKTHLLKINEKNPDIILFAVLAEPSAIRFLKQVKELNIDKQLLGSETFSFKSVISNSQAEGMLVATYDYDLGSAEMKSFLEDYKQKYGKDVTEEFYAVLGYDLYNLLHNAISSCGSDNPECIKKYLGNAGEQTGLSGTYRLDENGDAIRDVVLRRIEGGKLVAAG